MSNESFLKVSKLSKSFDSDIVALEDISFTIREREHVSILGPSGSGKSTLLRLVAGLDRPDTGTIELDNRSLKNIPEYKRDVGLMMQGVALFPHLNVFRNIAFGLKMAKLDQNDIENRVNNLLDLLKIDSLRNRDINTLSGGEKQRVALARSLAPAPRLLMLDEPLGAIDQKLRQELLVEMKEIFSQKGVTIIYVTHDQNEAFSIADKIIIINKGRIAQIGSPRNIFLRPNSSFVAEFMGMANLIRCDVVENENSSLVKSGLGDWPLSSFLLNKESRLKKATMLIPFYAVNPNGIEKKGVQAVVQTRVFYPGYVEYSFQTTKGLKLKARINMEWKMPVFEDRDQVSLDIDMSKVQLLPWKLSNS